MCADGLLKSRQGETTAIIPNTFFPELLLLSVTGPYKEQKVQGGWVASQS